MHSELIAIMRRFEMAVLYAAEHPSFLYQEEDESGGREAEDNHNAATAETRGEEG